MFFTFQRGYALKHAQNELVIYFSSINLSFTPIRTKEVLKSKSKEDKQPSKE